VDVPGWIGVALAAIGVVLSFLALRNRRGKTRLGYLFYLGTALVPERVASELSISFHGRALAEPSMAIVRIVSTGDLPIRGEDFETPIFLRLVGVSGIVSVTCTGARPPELSPSVAIDDGGEGVEIAPMLINSGDAFELQFITEGTPTDAVLSGRIANLEVEKRTEMPYPPGTGVGGELGAVEKLIWYLVMPGLAIALAYSAVKDNESLTDTGRVLITAGVGLAALIAWPPWVRYLERRSTMWEPPARQGLESKRRTDE